ncbi:extracellular matrix protein 2 [Sardina pilchardus]|uniref:extracellular matrix protein 2 n=1 Tax=Sardina pilchardus TaxID=27697 RepID=UPI002E0E99C5
MTTASPLWTNSPGAPGTDATSEQVDASVKSMTSGSRARRAGEAQRERRSGAVETAAAAVEAHAQSVLGRTAAVWVEMESVLGRRETGQGQLGPVLQDLREERKRLGFTDLLPEGCQQAAPLISCKDVGLTRLPIITDLAITTLELPGNNISKIPPRGFAGLPNLEEIDLSRNQLEDSSLGTYLFKNLTKLRKLNLDANGLTTVPLLPASLEELSIKQNRISQLLPKSFRGLFNLRSLALIQNELYDDAVSPLAFRPLKNIIYLRLDQNNFRSIPQGLPPSLQDLRMRENQLQEVDGVSLNKSVNLQVLDLSHNYLREHTISPQAWINLPKLEALDLSNNKFSLVPSNLPTALRQLSLQHNHIDTVPDFILGHLSPGLLSLRLSHNRIRNQGLKGPSFRGAYRTLTELLLDNNELEVVPRCMRVFRQLQLLRLDHNRIKAVPRFSLCQRQGRKSSPLAGLHLEHNELDTQKIHPAALTCMDSSSSVTLEPQNSSGAVAGAESTLS